MQSAIDYCIDQVREYDRDHFICSLFVPKKFRHNYLVLYTFNIEVNNIIYNTNEAIVAFIRLKWWHEKIDTIYQNNLVTDNHNIVIALQYVIKSANIPLSLFKDYLNGYEQMVGYTSYRNVEELEKIAVQTTVNLMKIIIIATTTIEHGDQIAYHCGIAWHLMNNLRNAKYFQNKTLLLSNKLHQKLIVEKAESHIVTTVQLAKSLKAIHIKLQAVLAGFYLKNMRKKKFNILNGEIWSMSPIMQFKLLLHFFKVKFCKNLF
ncbi:squalene/phytoene synthase family protein [Wolbachia endosymbiont of Pentidionis agamae]|uniref:squalene/phytoene synthase family protein n=1 Tax=Wolbachia endosymbiont of Pentidionis agamae TaxID=3110435 RepID=UPI002FD3FD44